MFAFIARYINKALHAHLSRCKYREVEGAVLISIELMGKSLTPTPFVFPPPSDEGEHCELPTCIYIYISRNNAHSISEIRIYKIMMEGGIYREKAYYFITTN